MGRLWSRWLGCLIALLATALDAGAEGLLRLELSAEAEEELVFCPSNMFII
jgi:hypothetical protein